MSIFERTENMIGKKALEKLRKAKVAVFGIGGVGSYVVEALTRAGIGAMDLIDADRVSESNIDRQLIALQSTVGKSKVSVAAERIHNINPDCGVREYNLFYLPEEAKQFHFGEYDYVVDAIDSVTGKLSIIAECKKNNTPVISSMGTGNKLYPEKFQICDIEKTSVCPLARVMRREARKRNLGHFDVLFSTEEPIIPYSTETEDPENIVKKKAVPSSISFVPAAAGLLIAGHVIREIAGLNQHHP